MTRRLTTAGRGGWVLCLGLGLGLGACVDDTGGATAAAPPPEAAITQTALRLQLSPAVGADGQIAVDLRFERREGDPGPRMMELSLQLEGDLHFVSVAPLSAATSAGKTVIGQDQGHGRIRAILMARDNTARVHTGPLLRVWLDPSGPGRVSLVDDRPVFAPAEADRALSLGPPLRIEVRP